MINLICDIDLDLERDNASQETVGLPPTKIVRNVARLSPSPSGRLDIQGFWNAVCALSGFVIELEYWISAFLLAYVYNLQL